MTERITPFTQAAAAGPRRLGIGVLDAAQGIHGSQGGTWKQLYTDVNGVVQEVALGASGTVLTSNGVAAAPTMQAVSSSSFKYKTADTVGRTNDTTFDNDPHLVVAIAASEVWAFAFVLTFIQAASADLKVTLTVPTSCVINWGAIGPGNGSTGAGDSTVAVAGVAASGTIVVFGTVSANTMTAIGHGTLINSTNAGDLQLQWGQQNSNANAITVLKGSHLLAWKVA